MGVAHLVPAGHTRFELPEEFSGILAEEVLRLDCGQELSSCRLAHSVRLSGNLSEASQRCSREILALSFTDLRLAQSTTKQTLDKGDGELCSRRHALSALRLRSPYVRCEHSPRARALLPVASFLTLAHLLNTRTLQQ